MSMPVCAAYQSPCQGWGLPTFCHSLRSAAILVQAAALEELGSRDAELSAQKAALEKQGAELEAWAAQVGTALQIKPVENSLRLAWMRRDTLSAQLGYCGC